MDSIKDLYSSLSYFKLGPFFQKAQYFQTKIYEKSSFNF